MYGADRFACRANVRLTVEQTTTCTTGSRCKSAGDVESARSRAQPSWSTTPKRPIRPHVFNHGDRDADCRSVTYIAIVIALVAVLALALLELPTGGSTLSGPAAGRTPDIDAGQRACGTAATRQPGRRDPGRAERQRRREPGRPKRRWRGSRGARAKKPRKRGLVVPEEGQRTPDMWIMIAPLEPKFPGFVCRISGWRGLDLPSLGQISRQSFGGPVVISEPAP